MTPEEKEIMRPSRVMLGNLLLKGLKDKVTGPACEDSIFDEILEAYEHYSAASPVLIAAGLTIPQFDVMEKKLDALQKLAELRKVLKNL